MHKYIYIHTYIHTLGVPQNGWLPYGKILSKWMIGGGTPISGNLHIHQSLFKPMLFNRAGRFRTAMPPCGVNSRPSMISALAQIFFSEK